MDQHQDQHQNQCQDESDYGLASFYEPKVGSPHIDIVLVHDVWTTKDKQRGLWIGDKTPPGFWPGWYPNEALPDTARIWTFGYHTEDHRKLSLKSKTEVRDFARDLLYHLGDKMENLGKKYQLPIVFIAHSMVGIIFKVAYNTSPKSNEYKGTTESASGLLFLGTTHPGTALTNVLTWDITTFGMEVDVESDPEIIANASDALNDINDKSLEVVNELYVACFSETVKARFGVFSQIMVNGELSILSLDEEEPAATHSDNRDTAWPKESKFRNIIRHQQKCIRQFGPCSRDVQKHQLNTSQIVHDLLGIQSAPDHDVSFLLSQHYQGTCEWIKSDNHFVTWLHESHPARHILWLHGVPGSGKSVLASYIVRHLKEELHLPCDYFFFKSEDQRKQSIVSLFRSFAFQLSSQHPQYRNHLAALAAGGYSLDYDTDWLIWNKLFAKELPTLDYDNGRPIYWIIDGLDICGAPESFISGLADPSLWNVPLRVLVLSRQSPIVSGAFRELDAITVDLDTIPARKKSIESLVKAKLGSNNAHMDLIARYSQGNFMWVTLVQQHLLSCYRDPSIAEAMKTSDRQFDSLWKRIILQQSERWQAEERCVAEGILTWATYAKFPLTTKQMETALRLQGFEFHELDISHLCGALIKIDEQSRVSLNHRTIQKFLIEAEDCDLHIHPSKAHGVLLATCLKAVANMPADFEDQSQSDSFDDYAIASWEYHLSRSAADTDHELLLSIEKFLSGTAMENWIYALAKKNQLNLLVSASTGFLGIQLRRDVAQAKKGAPRHERHAVDSLLEPWATELIGVLGKFGGHLVRYPKAIYNVLPPFLPEASLLRKRFKCRAMPVCIIVKSESNRVWDDILARLSTPRNPSKIACTNQHTAISSLSTNGEVLITSIHNPSDVMAISHGEPIQNIRFSNSGHMLVAFGYRKVSVFQLQRRITKVFNAPSTDLILDLTFNSEDTAILSCTESGELWRFPLDDAASREQVVASILADNGSGNKMHPKSAAFNQSGSMLVATYEDLPIYFWSLSSRGFLKLPFQPRMKNSNTLQSDVVKIGWISSPDRVLTVRSDGSTWIWYPETHVERRIVASGATDVRSSPTGLFLAIRDDAGGLSLWKADDFTLIYKIQLYHGLKDLTIGSDGCKIYGLRENACDVWGPRCLYRLSLASQLSLCTATTKTITPVSATTHHISSELLSPIEVLAIGPRTKMYCSAHSRGELRIFNPDGESLITPPFVSQVAITHITWSDCERFLAIRDVTNALYVNEIQTAGPVFGQISKTTLGTSAHQLLFNRSGDQVFIVSERSICTWSFRTSSEPCPSIELSGSYQWINHPLDADFLLGFGMDHVTVFRWSDLKRLERFDFSFQHTVRIPNAAGTLPGTPGETAENLSHHPAIRLFASGDGAQILIQISPHDYPRSFDLFSVTTPDIQSDDGEPRHKMAVTSYPSTLLERINKILGFIKELDPKTHDSQSPKYALAFIDRNSCLCTFNERGVLTEHSFLPHDWVDRESLALTRVTQDGTLFVPKDGEVRRIINGFRSLL